MSASRRGNGWGVFDQIMRIVAKFYAKKCSIKWEWQSIDSKSCSAPLDGEQMGKNPTSRGKRGSKIHWLFDKRGAPLAVFSTGANSHDKWSADDLIISIVVPRPDPANREHHICIARGHDCDDVHQFVEQGRYMAHITHHRQRSEPVIEGRPVTGETQFPARRRVVERTFGWLAKRRSLRICWCKKVENWLGFVQLSHSDEYGN